MRISVFNRAELQGTILRLKTMPRELSKQIRAQTKALGQPQWQSQLGQYGKTEMEQRVLVQSGRVSVSNQNVTLSSGGVGRSFQNGTKPSRLVPGTEFGGDREKVKTYKTRSRNGTSYTVTRHTQRQLPPRRKTGYVVYQAAAKFIPRMASLWVQTTVRTLHEAIERK